MTKRSTKKKRKSKGNSRSTLSLLGRRWSSERPRAKKNAASDAWWRSLWNKIPWRFVVFRAAEWLWSNRAKAWDLLKKAWDLLKEAMSS